MEKSDNPTIKEFKLKCVISSIKQYAEEHSLTAEQLEDIFNEGVWVCSKKGKIKIPSYSDDELPIIAEAEDAL